MDKVYAVFAGEFYESERLVSLHASLDGALATAQDIARAAEDGIRYQSAKDGLLWKARSGHYIAVEAKKLGA